MVLKSVKEARNTSFISGRGVQRLGGKTTKHEQKVFLKDGYSTISCHQPGSDCGVVMTNGEISIDLCLYNRGMAILKSIIQQIHDGNSK